MTNIKNIKHENGKFWVYEDKKVGCYTVFKNGITHATSDSSYPLTDDGYTLAVARCDYLASR